MHRVLLLLPTTTYRTHDFLEAARTLHSMKYGGVPVLDGHRLVGILTDTDLIACLVELLSHGG